MNRNYSRTMMLALLKKYDKKMQDKLDTLTNLIEQTSQINISNILSELNRINITTTKIENALINAVKQINENMKLLEESELFEPTYKSSLKQKEGNIPLGQTSSSSKYTSVESSKSNESSTQPSGENIPPGQTGLKLVPPLKNPFIPQNPPISRNPVISQNPPISRNPFIGRNPFITQTPPIAQNPPI